ncbi:GNAT family N-acetyltransferase [Pseudomonas koreensis]|uniref:GNAT family N-acetyltransferase n=1 Tax=Pseudomonas koreensis TaxID=198620 RepID=UPI0034A046DB
MTQRIIKNYKIATKYSEIKSLIPHVQKSADSQRSALGFLASSVYEEYARNERLYVLVNDLPDGRIYAGHLLFDMRYPRATIRQMFVDPEHRRGGLATLLLDHLRDILTSFGFTSIYARVALDLLDSNKFWERQRFYIQRQEKGGRY